MIKNKQPHKSYEIRKLKIFSSGTFVSGIKIVLGKIRPLGNNYGKISHAVNYYFLFLSQMIWKKNIIVG
jgi:hypothetical protein